MKKKIGTVLLVTIIALALGLLPAPIAVHAASTIFYVDADASGLNNGSSWENAYTDLQDALTNPTTDKEIWVAAGTYNPGTDRTDTFQLKSNVAVYGGFAGTETSRGQRNWLTNEAILSGDIGTEDYNSDNSYHVVRGNALSGNVVLDGFTITGGNANGSGENERGGGMYNHSSSSPTVTNCNFENNSANYGGGMLNMISSSPTVTNCNFENNSANYGSGMYNGSWMDNDDSSPTVTNCTFSGNSAKYGGGMFNNDSSPTVTDSTFSGNKATSTSYSSGGGMYNNESSSPTVTSCTFENNSASNAGGGMYNYDSSSPTVTNCNFENNSANYGGGMQNDGLNATDGSSPTVTNCTFENNSAILGGGMSNFQQSSKPTVTNCTFYENSAAQWGGGMFNNYSSPTVTNCTFSGNSAKEGGGGIFNNQSSSKPTVTNSILWNNSPNQIQNRFSSSPTVTYCDVQGGYTGESNINENPELDENLRLSDTSPAIDAGNNDAVSIDIDLDGNTRIVDFDGDGDAIVDMGAYEKQKVIVLATVDIDPDTLNLNSKGQGKWITCYIELEESYDVANIDVSTVKLNDEVGAELKPTGLGDYDDDSIPDLMVKFDRTSVQEILEVGDEVEIVITGELTDETSFEGTDTIKVIDKSND